jgi:hypothetical protein
VHTAVRPWFATGASVIAVTLQRILATALATQPAAASATAFSAKVSRAGATDVPDLSRKTTMIAVSPPTDTANPLDTITAAAFFASDVGAEGGVVTERNSESRCG